MGSSQPSTLQDTAEEVVVQEVEEESAVGCVGMHMLVHMLR